MTRVLSDSPRLGWRRWAVGATLGLLMLGAGGTALAEPATKVFLNGVPTPVYFNDGDSFRVLAGEHEGTKARLAGYNTLESYGPVHQWGGWTYKELYAIAKMATYNARDGVWHCESNLEQDTYGRILWWCQDLAVDQVKRGLAHAMSVNADPAKPELLEAQADAIAHKRGIWAHGVPDYVLTSLHSTAEATEGRKTYNRLVSAADGSSIKWRHDVAYAECAEVCDEGYESPERVAAATAALRADASLAFIGDYDDARLDSLIRKFAMKQDFSADLVDAAHKDALAAALETLRLEGRIGRKSITSCNYYVDFRRRFGGGKAECLK
ncbi:MAG: hypothetical protein EP329_17755 [Deltaproteobacteria bacterium]|nr:MAG: hypothetical protein EP329_17755 [Deltaproteobacteria bacterium]